MTTYVIDASVAVKWLVFEEFSEVAVKISQGDDELIAPRLILTEVANALAKKARRNQLAPADAERQFGGFGNFFDELAHVEHDLVESALRRAFRFGHPVYDMVYLEIARRRDIALITADIRLVSKIAWSELADHAMLLSDWRPT